MRAQASARVPGFVLAKQGGKLKILRLLAEALLALLALAGVVRWVIDPFGKGRNSKSCNKS
jgi:hypothetical protein